MAAGLWLLPSPVRAAETQLSGADLSILWALPFAAVLLSIALGPTLFSKVWHSHHGKIVLVWTLATIAGLGFALGSTAAAQATLHALLIEYMPFVILLFALFTISGGVVVRGNLHGSPLTNLSLLGIGTMLASLIGTTGASMILVRPLIRANDNRRHNVHTVIFFIFLVSNIGGSLTPLGDPPLFVGFLRGVDFFWTATHLWKETLFAAGLTLAIFFAIDLWLYKKEGVVTPDPTPDTPRLEIVGKANLLLILGVIGAILMSAMWRPGLSVPVFGVMLEAQNLLRDALLVGLALLSLKLTPPAYRLENAFTWEPIREVTKLFAAIFICIVPVLAMLAAGEQGPLAPLVRLVSGEQNPALYFWLTGGLSSILDNVPTYLVFFQLAGGDAELLMGPMADVLAAISSGAVFMGALTYIGNAPNFMVYAMARASGINMPSFFGYMAWSGLVLLPIFGLATLIFF